MVCFQIHEQPMDGIGNKIWKNWRAKVGEANQGQQHKVQKEKKRKEGVHAWSSRKDKDLYERVKP